MKVIQVVPRIDEEAGGLAYCVPKLSEALARLGADVHLHALAPAHVAAPAYRLHAHPGWRFPNRLGVSPTMRRVLTQESRQADVIHNNSLWMLPNVYPAWAARGTSCRLVTSPHGTLSSWALRRSFWRKRLMWLLAQGRAVRASHCFHATAETEYRDIRAAGLRGPVAIIPNGVDIGPEPAHALAAERRRRLLFLGRLHPIKGLDILLQAWQRLEPQFPDWDLRIVGNDEGNGYFAQLKQLGDRLGIRRVHFAGFAFGPRKTEQFQQADLFVLPSHSENFGVAVAEGLAHGLPAVVTKGAPGRDWRRAIAAGGSNRARIRSRTVSSRRWRCPRNSCATGASAAGNGWSRSIPGTTSGE